MNIASLQREDRSVTAMPSQSTSEISSIATSSTSKRSGDGESLTPNSHEYTICLLGDWAHMKAKPLPSPTTDNLPGPSAVYEVAADLDSPIVQVSCGSGWSCLLCEDGRAYSFGDNTYGQLGQGHNRPYVTVPVPMSTPFSLLPRRRIIRLSCGSTHGGFVLDIGELYMFGCGSYGRLGTGKEDNSCIPTMVQMKWSTLLTAAPGPTHNRKQHNDLVTDEEGDDVRFTDVSCGERHTLALTVRITRGNSDIGRTTTKSRTGIISFGDGMNGRLGLGDEKDRHEGALITTWLAASNVPGIGIAGNNGCMTPPTITAICAGSTHNLALSVTGDVFSWGNGVNGQLGHGTAVSEWVPRQLAFFNNLSISAISCGASHSTVVSRTGVVYTWGQGAEGQLGLDLEGDSTVDFVDKSVWVPHPVGILKGSTHRVTVRSIVAKNNMSMVLDDRDRMFVWGDNSLEQLGIPLSANTELGTKSFLPRPRLVAYMDLHAQKSADCNSSTSVSRVSGLRELVAAAKPDPIRLGLAHIDAGDRFMMLVFTTKPGISTSSNAAGIALESDSRTSFEVSQDHRATTEVSKWIFLLTDELQTSAIPSRESAFYQFMANYKVYVRPTISKSRDDEDSEDEMDRELQRRSPRRRDRFGSIISKRGSMLLPADTTTTTNDDRIDNSGACSSPAHVQGFDSWLAKRRNSPLKTSTAGHSFTNSPRLPSPAPKVEETRSVSSSETSKTNDATRKSESPSRLMKPQKPTSGFGRILSSRRPTACMAEPRSNKTISISGINSRPNS